MMALNVLDIIIIGITIISAIIGLFRGMIKEAITLLTWVIAAIVAVIYGKVVGNYIFGALSTELVRYIIGGFLLFIAILIIGGILNIMLSKFIKVSGFVIPDKILGTGFGILRSILVVLIVLPLMTDMCKDKEWWKNSVLVPKLEVLAKHTEGITEYFKASIPQNLAQEHGAKVNKK